MSDQQNWQPSSPRKATSSQQKRPALKLLWLIPLLGVVLLLVYLLSPAQPVFTTKELLARHLDPASVPLPDIDFGTPAPGSETQTRQTFHDNYRVNDYQDALSAARGLKHPTVIDSFFMAFAYLGIGQKDTCLGIFSKIDHPNNPYLEETVWLSALLNWDFDDLDAGLNQLRAYQKGDTYYPAAQEFLRAIESPK